MRGRKTAGGSEINVVAVGEEVEGTGSGLGEGRAEEDGVEFYLSGEASGLVLEENRSIERVGGHKK